MTDATNIHATCVCIHGRGVLILGSSGSGKSDLALRLIDRGAKLVSDDRVLVSAKAGKLVAASPGLLKGKIEVRGVGICDVPSSTEASVELLVRLTNVEDRLPNASRDMLCGISLPLLRLDPHTASAPIKVELALSQGVGCA